MNSENKHLGRRFHLVGTMCTKMFCAFLVLLNKFVCHRSKASCIQSHLLHVCQNCLLGWRRNGREGGKRKGLPYWNHSYHFIVMVVAAAAAATATATVLAIIPIFQTP